MTITPSTCVDCNLCEHSCPYGAIEKPVQKNLKLDKNTIVMRYITLVVIIPGLVIIGAWSGRQLHEKLALVNQKVSLAKELMEFEKNPGDELSLNIESFKTSGTPVEELYTDSTIILTQFKIGSTLLGAFIGLVIGLTLASLAKFKYRDIYEPNKGTCLSCARCIDFCPVENDNTTISPQELIV